MVRAAALAVCLLALALGASAQCDAKYLGKYVKADFVGTLQSIYNPPTLVQAGTTSHPIAVCLTGFTATIVEDAGVCKLQITPSNSGGSYIPGMWTGSNANAGYAQWLECPTTPGYKHTIGASPTDALFKAALLAAIAAFPYGVSSTGTAYKPFTLTNVDYRTLGFFKFNANGEANALFYAITDITVNDAFNNDTTAAVPLFQTGGAVMTVIPSDYTNSINTAPYNTSWLRITELSTLFHPTADVDKPCGVGAYAYDFDVYGHVLGKKPNQYKICTMCPAGTSQSGAINGTAATKGHGCTPCPAGTASQPGGQCIRCPPGTYSHGGSSQCLPCPTGTFSTFEGANNCYECPEDSYAWIPGSQYCMRCVDGVPQACPAASTTAPGIGVCPSGASSPGYAILGASAYPTSTCNGLRYTTTNVLASPKPEWSVKALTQCTTWRTEAPFTGGFVGPGKTLAFALRIAGDCSIQISPIRDESCVDPTFNRTTAFNPASPRFLYGELEMRAYYAPSANTTADPTNKSSYRIVSLFDTFADAVTSPPNTTTSAKNSMMLSINPGTGLAFNMVFFAATTDPAVSNPALSPWAASDTSPAYITPSAGGPSAVNVCPAPMTLLGGQLFGVVAANCPPGTYWDSALKCVTCPVGHVCTGGAPAVAKAVPCKAGEFNPFLGLGDAEGCEVCAHRDLRWTSYEGAASCTVEAYDPTCLLWSEAFGNPLGAPAYRLPTYGVAAHGAPIQHSGGKCFGPPTGVTIIAGTQVALTSAACAVDKFLLLPSGSFKHVASGMCLHPFNTTVPDGTKLVFSTACSETRLAFQPESSGCLRHVSSGKYLRPEGGGSNPVNGTRVEFLSTCTASWVFIEQRSFTSAANLSVDPTQGLQFDLAAQDCTLCPPGTFRDYTTPLVNECKLCPPGTYSDAGDYIWGTQTITDHACNKCPVGQYNPLEGLPNQNDTTNSNTTVCIECAVGSVALLSTQNYTHVLNNAGALSVGATKCEPCPAGTYQHANLTCVTCPAGTYRSGDATPENNVCKDIPAGYRLMPQANTTDNLTGSQIELCPRGTVSFWALADPDNTTAPFIAPYVRVPTNALACMSCASLDAVDPTVALAGVGAPVPVPKWAHTFAPRKGMTQCIPCPGGTIPASGGNTTLLATDAAAPADSCAPCPNGMYRDAYTVTKTCIVCPNGREVGPNSKMACTDCRPGFYKNDTTTDTGTGALIPASNNCLPCPKNTYRPTYGATSCLPCPRGTQTANTGNIECTACPIGYYNNAPGTTCTPAPAGTFVNVTGSFVTTLCPKGSWNNELAQDNCNPCAPGKYSNTLGSRECKTCAAGTYSAGQADSCISCRAGYFAPAGAGTCSPCKPGTYAPDVKSATCKLCPKGFQCPTNAMKLQGPCPRGTFSNKEGNRLCTPCPENTFSLGGGLGAGTGCGILTPCPVMACTKCAPGTNTRGLVGLSKCQVIRPQVRRLGF